jgi:hypothetical protein
VFIEAEPGLAKQAGVDGLELDFHQLRTASLDMFFKPYQSRSSLLPFGTSVFAIYEELYEREFKFVQRDDHRVALFERDEDNAAFVEAAFGGFPNDGFLAPLEKAYMDVFNPLKLTPNAEMSTRVIREELRTPLYFTRQDITREPARRSDNLTLFVVDPRNPLDLIDLWNIRSFSRYVVPVNIQWLVESSGYFRDLITKNHHPLPGNPNGVMTHSIVQFGRSITEERAKAVAQEALSGLPQGSWALQFGYERLWHDDGEDDQFWPPERARIAAKSHDLELAASRDHMDLSVRFPSLSPEFVTRYGDSAARWVNVVNFQTYDDKENIATVLPSDFTKTRSPRIRIGGHAIVSREGWVLPQKYPHHREYLHLLDGSQAVTEWLGQQGVAAKSSDAGRIAEQVLKALGGFWGAYLLADEETLRCLDRMAKSVRRHADGTVEEFPDRALPVVEWNALIARRKNRQFMPRLSLDEFVNANILKLGLSVECPNCLKKNWISLKGMDEEVGCERCLTRFPFPQGSLDFQHTPWQYRVVGPFSVPDYADGAYATVSLSS